MFRLEIAQSASTARDDERDFVIPVTVDVIGYGEDDGDYRVGRLKLDRILWAEAQVVGIPLFDVCDCDSQGMYQLHQLIADPDDPDEIRPDFDIEAPIDEVLFLHNVILSPDLSPHRAGLLDAVLATFGGNVLAVTWQGIGGTPDADLYAVGFKKVAGERVFGRHSTFPNPYAASHIGGLDGVFVATEEQERWVLARLEGGAGAAEAEAAEAGGEKDD